jgi:hypothetical protein
MIIKNFQKLKIPNTGKFEPNLTVDDAKFLTRGLESFIKSLTMVVRIITPVSMVMAATSYLRSGLVNYTAQESTCSDPKSMEGSTLDFCARLCYLIIIMRQAVCIMVCTMEVHPSLPQVSHANSITTGIEKYGPVKHPAMFSVWVKFTNSVSSIIYEEVTLLIIESPTMIP